MVPWVSNTSKPSVRREMKAGKNETKCGVEQLGGSRSKRLGGKGEVRVGTTWQFIWQPGWTRRLGRKEDTGGRFSRGQDLGKQDESLR